MLLTYQFFVFWSCVFLYFSSQLDAAPFEESTVSTDGIGVNATESSSMNLTQTFFENVTQEYNTSLAINNSSLVINNIVLNKTDDQEQFFEMEDWNKTESESLKGPECVINRGWFRRNIHLESGHSWFSASDCGLKVCNSTGGLDFYSCNRLDAWKILRFTIDREVNEGQLQCLKSGCI